MNIMKNFLSIFSFLVCSTVLFAQANIPNPNAFRHDALNKFSKTLKLVVNAKTPSNVKQVETVRLIGFQMANWHRAQNDITCAYESMVSTDPIETHSRGKTKSDQQADREMKQLAKNVESIGRGKNNISFKENRIIQLLGHYLSTTQVSYQKEGFDQFINGLSTNKSIDQTKVADYLRVIVAKNTDVIKVSNRMRKALGDEKNDPNLSAAIRIYEELGANRLGRKGLCEGKACDDNDTVNVRSRGAASLWQYTGEKRFFYEERNYGWRYRCVLIDPNQQREAKKLALNSDEKDMAKEMAKEEDVESDLESAWKKKENVDRW